MNWLGCKGLNFIRTLIDNEENVSGMSKDLVGSAK